MEQNRLKQIEDAIATFSSCTEEEQEKKFIDVLESVRFAMNGLEQFTIPMKLPPAALDNGSALFKAFCDEIEVPIQITAIYVYPPTRQCLFTEVCVFQLSKSHPGQNGRGGFFLFCNASSEDISIIISMRILINLRQVF